MSLICYLSLLVGTVMIASGMAMVGLGLHAAKARGHAPGPQPCPTGGDWQGNLALGLLGWGPILLALALLSIAGGRSGGP